MTPDTAFLAIVGVMVVIAVLFGVGHAVFALDKAVKKRTGFQSLSSEHLDAGHKAWNRQLFKTLLTMACGLLLMFAWVGRHEVWRWVTAPRPQPVKVVSVNYQRGEYTAITKAPGAGQIRFTAHCQGTCPALGKHDASETVYLYQAQNLISQAEER